MTKFYILLTSLALVMSCTSDRETVNFESIEIDLEQMSTLQMSEIYELKDIIYFSDSLIVDHIKKISRFKDYLVIHCARGLDYILIKNTVTEEEISISTKGDGPDQYKQLSDFFINSAGNIEVLDGKSGKILTYNLKGKLLSIYKNQLLQKAQNFMSWNGEDYFLYGGNFYAGSFNHQILVFNKTHATIIKKYIPIDPRQSGFMNFIEARNFNEGPAYFFQTYNPKIYEIDSSDIVDSLLFDFGNYNIPKEELTADYGDVRDFSLAMQKSGNLYGFSNVHLNDNLLIASGNQKRKTIQFYVDLESNQVQVYDEIENDLYGLHTSEKIAYRHHPLMMDQEYVYFGVNLEIQNEILTSEKDTTFNQSLLNEKLAGRIENFKEGDNLAIVMLTTKN